MFKIFVNMKITIEGRDDTIFELKGYLYSKRVPLNNISISDHHYIDIEADKLRIATPAFNESTDYNFKDYDYEIFSCEGEEHEENEEFVETLVDKYGFTLTEEEEDDE